MNETKARRLVYERSGGVCEVCAVRRGESWSHRLPKGAGGPWTPSNGLHTCGDGTRGCHGWIESYRTRSYERGWALRRGADPLTVPAFTRLHGGWVLLDDDGCLTPSEPEKEPSL